MTGRRRPLRPRSLGGRLFVWLALLSLTVSGIVFEAVYVSVGADFQFKQAAHLKKARIAVEHALAGDELHADKETIDHALDDLFQADHSVGIRLFDAQGVVRYDAGAHLWSPRARTLAFDLGRPSPLHPARRAALALDTANDEALLANIAAILLWAALAGSLAISLGSWLIVRFGLVPVRRLARETRGLAAQSLARRLNLAGLPDELLPLVEQFNALLERIERAYQQLESFNADVAHELRTPLANMIANGEVALRGAPSPARLEDAVVSSLEEARRMSGIVNDMLFLSLAERGARARCAPLPSLAALCAEVGEFHEAALLENEQRLEIHGDAAGAFDAPLLRRAVSNLLGNASRHADRGSVIVIRIVRESGDDIALGVENAGPAIPAGHLPHLFERFYRVDAARAYSSTNHGLGLAIVAAIARMHGGNVFARSSQAGAEIGFRLPGAEAPPLPLPPLNP